ncbi:MAG: hypothetical protein ITG01_14150 [Comamonas sp.]|nr:hypothetical protein [Comamonas sp.]
MTKPSTFLRCASAAAMVWCMTACDNEPQLKWQPAFLADAGLKVQFPCDAQVAQTPVDFGMDMGSVPVNMMGCDAVDSTYAVSHWLLDDAQQADDALAFWEAAVLSRLTAVDGTESRSGAPFIPAGAMDLSRSIRATVEGVGPAGWVITTHGVWFARQEGDKARIFHAVVYAPKAQHQHASTFFQSLALTAK